MKFSTIKPFTIQRHKGKKLLGISPKLKKKMIRKSLKPSNNCKKRNSKE